MPPKQTDRRSGKGARGTRQPTRRATPQPVAPLHPNASGYVQEGEAPQGPGLHPQHDGSYGTNTYEGMEPAKVRDVQYGIRGFGEVIAEGDDDRAFLQKHPHSSIHDLMEDGIHTDLLEQANAQFRATRGDVQNEANARARDRNENHDDDSQGRATRSPSGGPPHRPGRPGSSDTLATPAQASRAGPMSASQPHFLRPDSARSYNHESLLANDATIETPIPNPRPLPRASKTATSKPNEGYVPSRVEEGEEEEDDDDDADLSRDDEDYEPPRVEEEDDEDDDGLFRDEEEDEDELVDSNSSGAVGRGQARKATTPNRASREAADRRKNRATTVPHSGGLSGFFGISLAGDHGPARAATTEPVRRRPHNEGGETGSEPSSNLFAWPTFFSGQSNHASRAQRREADRTKGASLWPGGRDIARGRQTKETATKKPAREAPARESAETFTAAPNRSTSVREEEDNESAIRSRANHLGASLWPSRHGHVVNQPALEASMLTTIRRTLRTWWQTLEAALPSFSLALHVLRYISFFVGVLVLIYFFTFYISAHLGLGQSSDVFEEETRGMGFGTMRLALEKIIPDSILHPLRFLGDDEGQALFGKLEIHDQSLTWLRTAVKDHGKRISSLEDDNHGLLRVEKDRSGRLRVPEDFYQALSARQIKDNKTKDLVLSVLHDSQPKAIEKYLRQNAEAVSRILGPSLTGKSAKMSDKEAQNLVNEALASRSDAFVTHAEFVKLVEKEWVSFQAEYRSELRDINKRLSAFSSELEKLRVNPPGGMSRSEINIAIATSIRNAMEEAKSFALGTTGARAHLHLRLEHEVNYFATGSGAVIDPILSSSPWVRPNPKPGSREWRDQTQKKGPGLPPSVVTTPWYDDGDCFCAAAGRDGHGVGTNNISMLIARSVIPQHLMVEHILKGATLYPDTTPRDIEVWGKFEELGLRNLVTAWSSLQFPYTPTETVLDERFVKIGHLSFKQPEKIEDTVQALTFSRDLIDMGAAVRTIVVRAVSNYGADRTCFYRLRLYGQMVEQPHDKPIEPVVESNKSWWGWFSGSGAEQDAAQMRREAE